MIAQAVLYARISVNSGESVSVARQLESGRRYAQARGWQVVGEFVDDGVSATRLRPAGRPGWQRLLVSPQPFQAVVVWKVDRLTRRVVDFLRVHEELQARGAAVVCVEQTIDMSTGEGRAFAQILAVFGELEAATLSARLKAPRAHLIAHGRSPGGLQPYGFRLVPNPDGPGKVQAHDPERIDWVRQMVERALRGDTVYSILQWLSMSNAPAPRFRRPGSRWQYCTVQRILLNPVLAGMTPCNVGSSSPQHERGPEVLRDERGAPVIKPRLAIISVAEHEQLKHLLAHKTHHAAVKRADRKTSSPLLSMLATCADCGVHLTRFTHASGRVGLRCRRCGQLISMHLLGTYVEQRLLGERGKRPTYRRAWTVPDDETATRNLERIEHQLRTAALALTDDGADAAAAVLEVDRLKRVRAAARSAEGVIPVETLVPTGKTFAQVWAYCTSDEQRRAVLVGQIDRLEISRGRRGGRSFDEARVELKWRSRSKAVVPDVISLDGPPPRSRPPEPAGWLSHAEAARLTGLTLHTIRRAAEEGLIERRQANRGLPSLSRTSVLGFHRSEERSLQP